MFLELLREQAGPRARLPFDAFMDLALYHPVQGYYRREAQRVGRAARADFYTASSLGRVFGELVAAGCAQLLKQHGAKPADFCFVEIGAESPEGVLEGIKHPFASSRVLRLGQDLRLKGPCVLFSNELFDAQPCRRFVRKNGAWTETGVALNEQGSLEEIELEAVTEDWLPAQAPEGYRLDAPRAAANLARWLAREPWQGLFVAFDYGKTLMALTEDSPSGTVRAYYQHRQERDLLARPGEQDLTCHVCWDWIASALKEEGFLDPQLESQEAFLVHHAGAEIAAMLGARGGQPGGVKHTLMQLLHPGNMGQKFQVLHGWRTTTPGSPGS